MRHAACIACVLGALAAAPQPRQIQVPGAFRSSITLVPIDVRAVDRDGRPVTDLEPRDFTILEDGVAQEIAHFSRQALAPMPPPAGADARPSLRRPASFDMAPQKQRLFLIVLGRGRLREPSHATEALVHFVRERLLPQDQVAVLAWNRATDFTTDHEKVAQVIERFDRAHENIEGRLAFHFSSLAAAYGTREIPREIQARIDAVFRAPSDARTLGHSDDKNFVPSRELPPGNVTESARIAADARRVVGDLLASGNDYMTDLPFEEFVSENVRTLQDLGNLYAGIEYLRFLEGEKHLILVTEKGLFLPREEDDRRIAEAANTARVAIDTIETGGLYIGQSPRATQGGPNPGQWTQFWAFGTLRTIAELTGGQASICEWSRVAVDRIDDTTRAGYLLGYYPKNIRWDGAYRKIQVKAARPGVRLLYRRGYDATDQLVPFDRQAFLTFTRIMSAVTYPTDLRDIRVRATARRVEGGDAAAADATADKPAAAPDASAGKPGVTIQVDVKIDAANVAFEQATDAGGELGPGAHGVARRRATLDVALFAVESSGRVIGDRWQKIDLDLDEAAYEKARREGIACTALFPAGARAREVKVVVYDYAGDLLGSTIVRVF